MRRKLGGALDFLWKALCNPSSDCITNLDKNYEIGYVQELKYDVCTAACIYQAILPEHPDYAKTLKRLGWLGHYHEANSKGSLDLLKKSIEKNNVDPETWFFLGRVYWDLDKFDLSLDSYRNSLYLDCHAANTWHYIDKCHHS